MTAKDRFSVNLTCPKCGKSATAELWEYDGWSYAKGDQRTYVDSLPAGFTWERAKNDLDLVFKCSLCGVTATRS